MIDREDMLLTPQEHRALSEVQEGQYARKSGPKIVTMSYVNETDIIGCFGAKFQIHITHDGYVTPCDFTPLHFGNFLYVPEVQRCEVAGSHVPVVRDVNLELRAESPDYVRLVDVRHGDDLRPGLPRVLALLEPREGYVLGRGKKQVLALEHLSCGSHVEDGEFANTCLLYTS